MKGILVGFAAVAGYLFLLTADAETIAGTITDAATGRPIPGATVFVGDAMRLAQVLSNLLNNAPKCTGQKGEIDLSARSDGVQVEIRVRDNGVSIRADVLPRVFDMFERGRGDAVIGRTN